MEHRSVSDAIVNAPTLRRLLSIYSSVVYRLLPRFSAPASWRCAESPLVPSATWGLREGQPAAKARCEGRCRLHIVPA